MFAAFIIDRTRYANGGVPSQIETNLFFVSLTTFCRLLRSKVIPHCEEGLTVPAGMRPTVPSVKGVNYVPANGDGGSHNARAAWHLVLLYSVGCDRVHYDRNANGRIFY